MFFFIIFYNRLLFFYKKISNIFYTTDSLVTTDSPGGVKKVGFWCFSWTLPTSCLWMAHVIWQTHVPFSFFHLFEDTQYNFGKV